MPYHGGKKFVYEVQVVDGGEEECIKVQSTGASLEL